MAVVVFESVFLHDGNNHDVYLQLDASVSEAGTGPQSVVLLGDGSTRGTSGRGVVVSLDLTFYSCTRAEREQLVAWASSYLMYRDPRGRVLFGAYEGKSYTVNEIPGVDKSDVQVRFVGARISAEEVE